MLLNKKIKVQWSSKNRKHYEDLNYKFTKVKDEFEIFQDQLPRFSKVQVDVECDYCKTIFSKRYINYISEKEKSLVNKDCCKGCSLLKNKEIFIKKYGVDNPNKCKQIREKTKQTNLERYGTEYVLSNKDVREKIKQTNLERYGTEYAVNNNEIRLKIENTNLKKYNSKTPLKDKEVQEKIKRTNLQRYGVEYGIRTENAINNRYKKRTYEDAKFARENTTMERYNVKNVFQNKEIKDKIKQTNLKKYGVENPSQNKEIKEKQIESWCKSIFKNETGPCSKQQKYLHDLLGGELNYPVSKCLLDIAFPDEMIYIEYNGGGHYAWSTEDEVEKTDLNRYRYLKDNYGWKLIKIIAKKDKLPTDEQIIKLIEESKFKLRNGLNWIEINFDIDPNLPNILEDEDKDMNVSSDDNEEPDFM